MMRSLELHIVDCQAESQSRYDQALTAIFVCTDAGVDIPDVEDFIASFMPCPAAGVLGQKGAREARKSSGHHSPVSHGVPIRICECMHCQCEKYRESSRKLLL